MRVQVIHSEATVGVHKADSAAAACRSINSSIEVSKEGLTPGGSKVACTVCSGKNHTCC